MGPKLVKTGVPWGKQIGSGGGGVKSTTVIPDLSTNSIVSRRSLYYH